MNTKHTPEWPEFDSHPNYGKRLASGNDAVILNRTQYNRARACVNARAGVDTKTLVAIANGEMNGSEILELAKVKQQRDELLAALVKHGKHGIHCRPEYMISTGQIIGYKCVDISCPVATAIAKAGEA